MTASHDYHIDAEPDVGNKVNRHIIFYFVLLGIALFGTIGGLTIMYRFELDYQKEKKIGLVDKRESIEQMRLSHAYLSGNKALQEGKVNVPIGVAMDQFLSDLRKEK